MGEAQMRVQAVRRVLIISEVLRWTCTRQTEIIKLSGALRHKTLSSVSAFPTLVLTVRTWHWPERELEKLLSVPGRVWQVSAVEHPLTRMRCKLLALLRPPVSPIAFGNQSDSEVPKTALSQMDW